MGYFLFVQPEDVGKILGGVKPLSRLIFSHLGLLKLIWPLSIVVFYLSCLRVRREGSCSLEEDCNGTTLKRAFECFSWLIIDQCLIFHFWTRLWVCLDNSRVSWIMSFIYTHFILSNVPVLEQHCLGHFGWLTLQDNVTRSVFLLILLDSLWLLYGALQTGYKPGFLYEP